MLASQSSCGGATTPSPRPRGSRPHHSPYWSSPRWHLWWPAPGLGPWCRHDQDCACASTDSRDRVPMAPPRAATIPRDPVASDAAMESFLSNLDPLMEARRTTVLSLLSADTLRKCGLILAVSRCYGPFHDPTIYELLIDGCLILLPCKNRCLIFI
jgi:hypothetical protein